jgi:hypothetical protein
MAGERPRKRTGKTFQEDGKAEKVPKRTRQREGSPEKAEKAVGSSGKHPGLPAISRGCGTGTRARRGKAPAALVGPAGPEIGIARQRRG